LERTTNPEMQARSPVKFDYIQPARFVGEVDEATVVHGNVVGQRRLLAEKSAKKDLSRPRVIGNIIRR
jgi:hypothetical protein